MNTIVVKWKTLLKSRIGVRCFDITGKLELTCGGIMVNIKLILLILLAGNNTRRNSFNTWTWEAEQVTGGIVDIGFKNTE